MKPFLMTFTVQAVVIANDIGHAYSVANLQQHDIFNDMDVIADSATEITSLNHLTSLDCGWDKKCIPYGGDGNTRLENLLPDDNKTICMFQENDRAERRIE